jgi:homoserine O-acetyltransferase
VRTQAALADHLGVDRWLTAVGGSMGGMMVLEWAIMFPDRVRSVVPIATCVAATAQQIGWWSTGRRVIHLDPRFRGGDYYDAAPGDGPHEGLALARMISQITFRSDDVFTDRFGREVVEPLNGGFSLWQRFEVERYLEYHGDKLVRRFDANTYLLVTKAMDLHDIGRGRGDVDTAVRRIEAPVLAIGISSDILYPAYQSREIVECVNGTGGDAEYVELDSPHGHDAFLLEFDQVGGALTEFLKRVEKDG